MSLRAPTTPYEAAWQQWNYGGGGQRGEPAPRREDFPDEFPTGAAGSKPQMPPVYGGGGPVFDDSGVPVALPPPQGSEGTTRDIPWWETPMPKSAPAPAGPKSNMPPVYGDGPVSGVMPIEPAGSSGWPTDDAGSPAYGGERTGKEWMSSGSTDGYSPASAPTASAPQSMATLSRSTRPRQKLLGRALHAAVAPWTMFR